jgi:hypothetical protein
MSRKAKFSEDQVKSILGLLDTGITVAAIAKKYKTSAVTIYNLKKKSGVSIKKKPKAIKPKKKDTPCVNAIVTDPAMALESEQELPFDKIIHTDNNENSGKGYAVEQKTSGLKETKPITDDLI